MTAKPNLTSTAADILVVDDTIDSLRLLSDILTQAGYRVRPAERPQLALQSALAHPPGLILLDVRMPEMDGFELCRRLKQDERTAEIPVIFISALQDTEDKVRGFAVGGVDFVSKPFEEAEVLARVKTHLQLRTMQLHLEELVAERTDELRAANEVLQIEVGERKQAESLIAEQKELLENTLESLAHPFYVIDSKDHTIILANSAARELGVSGAMTCYELTHQRDTPCDGTDHTCPLIEVKKSGKPVTVEHIHLDANGEKAFVELRGYPIFDADGNVVQMIEYSLDITERRNAEAALGESEEKYRILVEQANDGFAVIQDGEIKFVNKQAAKLSGRSVEEMLNTPFMAFIPAEELPKINDIYQRRLKGEAVPSIYESAVRHENGSRVEVEFNAGLTTYNGRVADQVIIRDISERKRAEEVLRASEIRLESAVRGTELGIWDYDMVSGYVAYDERWAGMLGYTLEELAPVPDTWSNFLHPDDEDEALAQLEEHWAGNREDYSLDIRMKCKSGAWKWINTRGKVVERDEDGRPLRMTGTHLDIDERKKVEQELHNYQQRLKALAAELTLAEERERRRIAADLHDHVSQSLALARIQLGTARKADSESRRNGLLDDVSQTLLKAIQDTRSLIFDLSSPMLNDLGLATAVSAWLRDQIGTPYNLETKFDDDGQKKPLTEDLRAILFRNVRELLVNAARHAQANEIEVSLERQDASIKIMIRDDGVGFDPQQAVQMDHKKGGFGLFSIQERMADLGGSLEIISAPGEGCTAVLIAPLNLGEETAGK